jgi:hypothetical protein
MVAIEVVECVGSAAAGADNCVAIDRPVSATLAKRSAVYLDAEPTITTGRTARGLMASKSCYRPLLTMCGFSSAITRHGPPNGV